MGGPGSQQALQLLGREPECAAIDTLLENARADMGGSLVVRGEAGIGKTALLDYARQRAAPAMVLSASGVEAESDLAFAGLHELLRPVLRCLGDLPGTQSQALAGALGMVPSAQPDRLLISAAVLGILAAAAEARPVLCVIDDAQWVDRPSADALVFTAGGCGPRGLRSCSLRERARRAGSRRRACPRSPLLGQHGPRGHGCLLLPAPVLPGPTAVEHHPQLLGGIWLRSPVTWPTNTCTPAQRRWRVAP